MMEDAADIGRCAHRARHRLDSSGENGPLFSTQPQVRCDAPGVLSPFGVLAIIVGKNNKWGCASGRKQSRNADGRPGPSRVSSRIGEIHWYECTKHFEMMYLQVVFQYDRLGGHETPVAEFCAHVAGGLHFIEDLGIPCGFAFEIEFKDTP